MPFDLVCLYAAIDQTQLDLTGEFLFIFVFYFTVALSHIHALVITPYRYMSFALSLEYAMMCFLYKP